MRLGIRTSRKPQEFFARRLGVGTTRLRYLADWGPSLCGGASTPRCRPDSPE